jgi:3-phytase
MKSTIEVLLLGAALATPALADAPQIEVSAQAETAGTRGDADDPAIWVNPDDPATSLILGTDKQGGLRVYDLQGDELAFLPDGKLNNVDLRPFTLAGRAVTLASAARREDDTLVFYIVDADGVRHAEPFAHPAIPVGATGLDDIYGSAMAQVGDEVHVLVNFKSGHVLQYRVTEAEGQLSLVLLRQWQVGSQPEGMVADDAAGHIYLGEEDVGIWRFALDPSASTAAFTVDAIPSDCLPRDDVEGLAIHDDGQARYLVASAQGVHRAAIYRLDGEHKPACIAQVAVVPGAIDGVTETDGLDVTALPVGAAYPKGLLVMMDDQNAGFTTNFKLIDWAAIAAQLP